MALVYRAIWDDESASTVALLDDEFKAWCAEKKVPLEDLPHRGRLVLADGRWLDVRRADVEAGRALRCTLAELDNRGRTWTTTSTALSDDRTSTLWVDLDCHDPRGGRLDMAAPRLVRALIANGGEPTIYGRPIRTDARVPSPPQVGSLLDDVRDPSRQIPIVVFSPDQRAHPTETIERANAAAESLAGIAHVFALSPLACERFNSGLPDGFRVFSGAVRMYLPELRVDDPDDQFRHRFFPLRQITSHPRRAASMLASRLARLQVHPPIPEAWERLGPLLRRPSEDEVDSRAATITSERATRRDVGNLHDLREEVQDLTKLLAEADLIREELERDSEEEIRRLTAAISAAESERYDDAAELEDLRRQVDGLQRNLQMLLMGNSSLEEVRTEKSVFELAVPEGVAEAIDAASDHLDFVEIHSDAPRDIDELDETAKYQVWGAAVWSGLLALNEYARAKSSGEPTSGFHHWCESTGMWPTSKLAMTESESVRTNGRFLEQRRFPVSRDVDRSGRVVMLSHLKIQVGGGDNIPRLYFLDDTEGSTGKMHIGFIGPHRHVRNTRS